MSEKLNAAKEQLIANHVKRATELSKELQEAWEKRKISTLYSLFNMLEERAHHAKKELLNV